VCQISVTHIPRRFAKLGPELYVLLYSVILNNQLNHTYRCTVHSVVYFSNKPNKCTYIVFNNLKFTLKHLKTLPHVSIIRSSSESILCYLLNLKFTSLSILNCKFSNEQSMLPEDDRMIETCRSVFKCFNVNFRLLKTIYVHLFGLLLK